MKFSNEKKSKMGLGIALIALGFILTKGNQPVNPVSSSFASEPVIVSGFEEGQIEESKFPRRIIIPAISIDIEVDESDIVNGYWEVFEDKAGWGKGSGIPGEEGNQVIFAHAREGLFLPLKTVKKDMLVYVLTQEGWYDYKIDEIKEVYPNKTQVIAPTDNEEILTLYTCSGFSDSKRLIVKAKRI